MVESFIIPNTAEALQKEYGFKVIGPSQSLFFQNF